jgi:hypothetical protein
MLAMLRAAAAAGKDDEGSRPVTLGTARARRRGGPRPDATECD